MSVNVDANVDANALIDLLDSYTQSPPSDDNTRVDLETKMENLIKKLNSND